MTDQSLVARGRGDARSFGVGAAFALVELAAMTHASPIRSVIFLTIGLLLSVPASAHAWTRRTPSLPQQPGGYVYCRVLATSRTPISIVATVANARATNVTEFGFGSRIQVDGGYQAEETAGSYDDASSGYYCKVTVTGARKEDTTVTFTSYDRDGVAVVTVTPR